MNQPIEKSFFQGMKDKTEPEITDRWILSCRGAKNTVDYHKPYALNVEKERTPSGRIEDVATIFLTNRECPFHCLMCDLWKNTTDRPVPEGAIPNQIEWALKELPPVRHLKLYNSGSFFDRNAISEKDYEKIASLTRSFETVIVESHPQFIDDRCLRFRDMLKTDLQVAIGLEVADREILRKLNKAMDPDDFASSVKFLKNNSISSRAFILLRPPFLSEPEGIFLAKQSLGFAFSSGVECCVIIPVRAGNGVMDSLKERGLFTPPEIRSLENVLEYGINLKTGRVFADTWDLALFSKCDECLGKRISRITEMNLNQKITPSVKCKCDTL